MEGEKDDLSTHLKWFRNRNRKNFVNGYQNDEENSLPLWSSSLSVTSLTSSWLQTTLFDLDQKTKTMLELIEEDDADSFAKRAEMYYKRRPQLIHMVQEFHRAHRSLAERYQLIMNKKNPSYCDILPKTSTITSSSSSSEDDDIKSYPDSISTTSSSTFCCSFSADNNSLSSDPDEDQNQLKQESEAATLPASNSSDSMNIDHGEVMVVRREEMESLVDENKKLKEQLMQKDEEKREVIRQLCFSLDFLRNENEDLMAMMMRKNGYDHITHNNELNVLEQKKISC